MKTWTCLCGHYKSSHCWKFVERENETRHQEFAGCQFCECEKFYDRGQGEFAGVKNRRIKGET